MGNRVGSVEIRGGGRWRPRVETATRSRGGSSRSSVNVQDPLKAVGCMVGLLLLFALLFTYVVLELPGISPAGRRAQVSPCHPSNGPALSLKADYMRVANRASGEIKGLLEAASERRAHARP